MTRSLPPQERAGDLELDDGRTVPMKARYLRAARHDARLGRQGLGASGLRLRPDRRRACREGRKKADDPLPDALTEALVAGCYLGRRQVVLAERHHRARLRPLGAFRLKSLSTANRSRTPRDTGTGA